MRRRSLPLRLVGQHIRDLSFEAPGAPDIFSVLRTQQPDITVSLDTNVRQLAGSPTFEVMVTIQLDAVANGKKAFILELSYGCVVEINDQLIPRSICTRLLMIEIPRQMFPFIRQIVADVTANGGFPPLMLQVFDFADIYRKKFGNLPPRSGRRAGRIRRRSTRRR